MRNGILWLVIAILVLAIGNLYSTSFSIISSSTNNFSIQISQDLFIYNSSEVVFADGSIKLNGINKTTEKEAINNTYYSPKKALYSEVDKTDQIASVDKNDVTLNENKNAYLFLKDNLSDGDIISFYITSKNNAVLKVCDLASDCDKTYGSASYTGSEGLYNITLSGLAEPSKVFRIVSTDKASLDQIKSDKSQTEKFLLDTEDKISKIKTEDSETQTIGKNKFLYLIFSSPLPASSVIGIVVFGGDDSGLNICDSPSCATVYGHVDYKKSQKGFYNTSLSAQSTSRLLVLDSEKTIDIDSFNATFSQKLITKESKIVYPASSSIETKDITIQNIASWDALSYQFSKKNQTANIYYSTDSGSSWTDISLDSALNRAPTNSTKIRFRFNLSSDTTGSPEISNIKISYTTLIPYAEKQRLLQGSTIPGSETNITFKATNPLLIDQAYADLIDSTAKLVKTIYLTYDKSSDLFIGKLSTKDMKEGVYSINLTIKSNYTESKNINDVLVLLSESKGSTSSVPTFSGDRFLLDSKQNTSSTLSIKASSVNSTINIIGYSKNIKSVYPKEKEAGKYLEIVPEEKVDMEYATIRIYYTDEELLKAGISEDKLGIQYYNETSGLWEKLDSAINTTGKYVEVATTHFSTYGLFGEALPSTASQPSSGRQTYFSPEPTNKAENRPPPLSISELNSETRGGAIENKKHQEGNGNCSYDLHLILHAREDSKIFSGDLYNDGNCPITQIQMSATDNIKDIVSVYPEYIESMEPGEHRIIDINPFAQNAKIIVNPIEGLAIGSIDKSIDLVTGEITAKGFSQYQEPVKKSVEILIDRPLVLPGRQSIAVPVLSIILAITIFFAIGKRN